MKMNFHSIIFLPAWLLVLASTIPAAGTAASAPFRTDDPLGINVDDVAALNTLPEQALLRT
ncbi:MAG: hypothetical protein EPN23_04240 [Verrucomicrobia bacterium]|nr:MAG: hypothetical protein EPN23_04240 [Verrucomicrobiota bacterium]